MNAFAKSLLRFIPIAICIYIVLVSIWGTFVPQAFRTNMTTSSPEGNTHQRLEEVKRNKDIDILFLGSSRAFSVFDTRMYQQQGYSVFNMGTSSQTPLQTIVLLHRYLDQLHPQHIIFEVSPLMFSSDGIESYTDIIANDQLDYHATLMTCQAAHINVLNTLIYKTYRTIIGTAAEGKVPHSDKHRRYIEGGFVEVDIKDYQPIAHLSSAENIQLNTIQLEAFEAIVQLIAENGIKLTLVQVPFIESKYQSYQSINQQFDSLIQQNGTYHNFNRTMNWSDSTYFRDEIHLNQRGIERFNKQLMATLGLDK